MWSKRGGVHPIRRRSTGKTFLCLEIVMKRDDDAVRPTYILTFPRLAVIESTQ